MIIWYVVILEYNIKIRNYIMLNKTFKAPFNRNLKKNIYVGIYIYIET
jgi:hypothetical protein